MIVALPIILSYLFTLCCVVVYSTRRFAVCNYGTPWSFFIPFLVVKSIVLCGISAFTRMEEPPEAFWK